MAHDNVAIVREFIETWPSLDAEALAGFFRDDGCYHNMPLQPVNGKANIKAFIAAFLATWTHTEWEIRAIAGVGDTVFVERLDKTRTTRGNVDLPCVGVFEMAQGKIQVWRDYFDMATYTNAMQA